MISCSKPGQQWLKSFTKTTLSRSSRPRHSYAVVTGSIPGDQRHVLCYSTCQSSFRESWLSKRLQLRQPPCVRNFQSTSDYNRVADESLDALQDALDDWMEDNMNSNDNAEVVLASGVLTLKLPPHGTWVINKQSTTQQIWWSSPLSGPKRFEFADGAWWSTKDGLNMNSQLAQELHRCFPNASELAIEEE